MRVTIHFERLRRTHANKRRTQKTATYKSLLQYRTNLTKTAAIHSLFTTKAQHFNLIPIKVIGDGNCLQYAVNAAHKEQTNHYLANNDDLRLLATALARRHIQKQQDQPQDLIDAELKVIELTAKDSHFHYPGTYMNALASIRNGPLIVISDIPGEGPATFFPLQEMTDILDGNPTTHATQVPQEPHLPPIYILNRTTLDPEHFDATKLVTITPTTFLTPPTTTSLLDSTVTLTPLAAKVTAPPTIERRLHHPELNSNWDGHYSHPTQKPITYSPPDDQPEYQQPLIQPANTQTPCNTSTQTGRRPRTQISSTPSSKNNHSTSPTTFSKKGRPGPTLLDTEDTQSTNYDPTLSPPRPPIPPSPSEHWGSEDESPDTLIDCPDLNKESPMQNDPQERFEDTTQGPDLQPPLRSPTQEPRQKTKPKATLNKTRTANAT